MTDKELLEGGELMKDIIIEQFCDGWSVKVDGRIFSWNHNDEDMGMINDTQIKSESTTLKPTQNIDLEALEFHEGGHLMTNRKTVLPETAWRAQKDGY